MFQQFTEVDTITPLYNVNNYAKEAKFRLEVAHKRAQTLLNRHKLRQKSNYDRNVTDDKFSVGDMVLLKNETAHKIDPKYKGPYKIIDILKNNNIKILDNKINKEQIVHANRLKIYNS